MSICQDPQPVAILVTAFGRQDASSHRPRAYLPKCDEPHLVSTVVGSLLLYSFQNNSLRRHGVWHHVASNLACLFPSLEPGTWFHPVTAKFYNRRREREERGVGGWGGGGDTSVIRGACEIVPTRKSCLSAFSIGLRRLSFSVSSTMPDPYSCSTNTTCAYENPLRYPLHVSIHKDYLRE
jgi:hypothetical protein